MPFGLTENVINKITSILAESPGVSRLVLFGSRAKGNFKPGSDIDIAVYGNNLSLDDFLNFSIQVDKLELANKVDLVHFQKIGEKDLIDHIARVGIVLYEEGIFRNYGLPPVISGKSKILILGSFPSEQSLEKKEYYANPNNQFWKTLCGAYDEAVPADYSGKLSWLDLHRIALWDTVGSCLRQGSSDSRIKYPLPNDIGQITNVYRGLTHLLFNGNNPLVLFSKLGLTEGRLVPVPPLPSTSSMNTWLTLPEKIDRWRVIRYIPSLR